MFQKKINFIIVLSAFFFLFVLTEKSFTQETKWIQIGALHGWFADKGCEIEVGRSTHQQDGLRWPAFFDDQDTQAAKGLWIGATNFTDEKGTTYPNKVICCGTRLWGDGEFYPVTFTMATRFAATKVYVDGTLGTYIQSYVNGDPDATLAADRVITNVVNTSMGIQMTRKIYAFSQQNHDNYFIYDYVFKNTGDVNNDGKAELSSTLQGLYFYFQNRYSCTREGSLFSETGDPTQWGINCMIDSRGDDVNSTDAFRASFAWHGKYSKCTTHDNIGAPNFKKDGHLGAAQYVGWLTIHADKSSTDTTDDRTQPKTVSYEESDDNLNRYDVSDQFNSTKMTSRYAWITRGYYKPRLATLVGDGYADNYTKSGGFSNTMGYGPYTLKSGESVHIVIAEGVAGLSREQCYKIGADWLAKKCTFGTVTDNDKAKDAWVATGRDSLFKTFNNAISNYGSGFKIAQPPLPPGKFEVTSGGDRITLTWSNSTESDATLKSYRIYRTDSTWDNLKYTMIAEIPKGTLTFDDKTASRGYSYYYYLQAVGDGSNNNGVPLVSNRQFTQTYDPAYLMREAGIQLSEIRIVPNPYNIKAQSIQYKGEKDKIMFLNIPKICTIKIYTERGDLIKTIEHTNGSGDESWNSITSYNQVVVSGVYIAYFETPEGQNTFRKFVIIR
jgi:hypothetical protein